MPHKDVKDTITELKSELEQTPKETSLLEQELEQAREGIERYTPEAIRDLAQTLQNEAKEFEVEHPRVTALINQLMTALSNLGIICSRAETRLLPPRCAAAPRGGSARSDAPSSSDTHSVAAESVRPGRRKLLLSWSSGKDGARAIHRLRQEGEFETDLVS